MNDCYDLGGKESVTFIEELGQTLDSNLWVQGIYIPENLACYYI